MEEFLYSCLSQKISSLEPFWNECYGIATSFQLYGKVIIVSKITFWFWLPNCLIIRVLIFSHTIKNVFLVSKRSYHNYLDVDSAWNCVSDSENPTCAVMKHTNLYGEAYRLAVIDDPCSTFGGIVVVWLVWSCLWFS